MPNRAGARAAGPRRGRLDQWFTNRRGIGRLDVAVTVARAAVVVAVLVAAVALWYGVWRRGGRGGRRRGRRRVVHPAGVMAVVVTVCHDRCWRGRSRRGGGCRGGGVHGGGLRHRG